MTTPWADHSHNEDDPLDLIAEVPARATSIQPLDPDGPPMPCSTAGCREGAVVAAGAHGLAACHQHVPAMVMAMNQATSGTVYRHDHPTLKNRKQQL